MREAHRFARFAAVGLSGAVVDFLVFNLLHHGLGWSLILSNVLSVGAAIGNNFHWNRTWTFAGRGASTVGRPLARFVAVSLVGLALNTALVVLGVRALPGALLEPLRSNVAKAIAVACVLVWNYSANRFWTFRGEDRR